MASEPFYAYAVSPNGSINTNYRGKVVITDTPIAGKNASSVTLAFYMWYTGSGSHAHKYNYGNALTVVIDGETVINASNYKAIDLNGTSESKPLLYASKTKEMQHNADGTKTFSFLVKYDQTQTGGSLDYLQITGSYTNEVISLASSLSLPNEMIMGTKVKLLITQPVASYTHTVKYAAEGKTPVTIGEEKTSKRELEWEIPMSLAAEYPNKMAVPCDIFLQTYNGDTPVGEQRGDLRMLKVPAPEEDERFKFEIPDDVFSMNSEYQVIRENGEYFAGKCSVRAQIKQPIAGDQYGASVVSAVLRYGSDENKNSKEVIFPLNVFPLDISVNVIPNGDMTAALTLTNSRGRSITKKQKLTVKEYSSPTINAFDYYRCDVNGKKLQSGQYVKVEGTPIIADIPNKRNCR